MKCWNLLFFLRSIKRHWGWIFKKYLKEEKENAASFVFFFSLSTTRTTPDQAGGAGGRQTIRTLGIHGRNDKAHEVVARKAQYQPWPEPSSSAATEKKNTSCILPWKPQDFWCWLLYFVSSVLIIYESFLMLYYIYFPGVLVCFFFFFEIKKTGKWSIATFHCVRMLLFLALCVGTCQGIRYDRLVSP